MNSNQPIRPIRQAQGEKGFSAVALIIIVGVLVFAGAFGVRYLTQRGPDETADWKTYKNEKYGYEFKYPPTAELFGTSKPKIEEHKPPLPTDSYINVNIQGGFSVRVLEDAEIQHYPAKLNERTATSLGSITNKGTSIFQGQNATYFDMCGETDCERVILVKKDGLNYQLTFELRGFGLSSEEQATTEEINKTRKKILDTFKFIQPSLQSNIFQLEKIKVGDTVAGMKVVSIGPVLRNLPLSSKDLVNMSIKFSGEAQISGEYQFMGGVDDPITCNYFKLDEVSRNNLPGLKDVPLNSLCFAQDPNPKLDFKRGGRATVVIDDLLLNYVAAGIPSGARIVKVIEDRPK